MHFFLDVFTPTELKVFPGDTITKLTLLKRDYYKPEINLQLNEANFLAYSVENIFLNCFALYKYKPRSELRNGFINYLLSTSCLLEYFRRIGKTDSYNRFVVVFDVEASLISSFDFISLWSFAKFSLFNL